MPAIASLEDLSAVNGEVKQLKTAYPQAYSSFCALFKRYRKVGYKNICKLILEEATPEKLKGLE
jgi:hypothetical protein